MKISTLKISAAALLPSVATMLFVQACGGSSDADAQATPDPIEGVWESSVTLRDCATGAPTNAPVFRSAMVFHRGGTFTDASSHPPTARSPGFGHWSPGDAYGVTLRFFRYNPDGSLAGNAVTTMSATLAADGKSFEATRSTQLSDPAGKPLTTVCASDVATKLG